MRFADVTTRNIVMAAMVIALALSTSARADFMLQVSCGSLATADMAACDQATNQLADINGFEGVEMNFFGSQDASSDDVAFKNVSFFLPLASRNTSSESAMNTAVSMMMSDPANGVVSPVTADPPQTLDMPAGNGTMHVSQGGTSAASAALVLDTSQQGEIVKSVLLGSQPLADPPSPNAVPEPAYSVPVALISGLAILMWRRRSSVPRSQMV